MSSPYPLLGMDTAWRRFDAGRSDSHSLFAARLRTLEAAVPAVNLTPDTVHLAAEIAGLEPDLHDDERLALIVLILVSLAALSEGSTRFPVVGSIASEPMQRMLEALCGSGFGEAGPATMAGSIELLLQLGRACAVVGSNPDSYKPLLFIAPYIFHQRVHRAEGELACRLASMLTNAASQGGMTAGLSNTVEEASARSVIMRGTAILLSAEQRVAVANAARQGLTIVSGGPGTGKTSIVVAIMRLMVRLGVAPEQIALAAPTGKAAYRLGECVREALGSIGTHDQIDRTLLDARPEPATIHRMLGYSQDTGRFRHHRNNPLAARVVIVDECSMLDLALMERLTDALEPGTRLVLLGDADQLPSVAAGCVFRDLAQRDGEGAKLLTAASIHLVENHRMRHDNVAGRSILSAARAINEGNAELLGIRNEPGDPIVVRRATPAELSFAGVEFVPIDADDRTAFLDLWHETQLRCGDETLELIKHTYVERQGEFDAADCARLHRLFEHFGSSRILCVTRVFETGADRINARLHSRAAQTAGVAAERVEYVVGEPLIVVRNDYDRGLFNGDNGIRLWVRRDDRSQVPMAVFPRGDNFVAFPFESMRNVVELGYAMTVHKAQGSEFDTVAIFLPEEPLPMLTRELLYTAVSRSRKSVVLLGAEERVREAIGSRVARFSGLSDRIKDALGASSLPRRTR